MGDILGRNINRDVLLVMRYAFFHPCDKIPRGRRSLYYVGVNPVKFRETEKYQNLIFYSNNYATSYDITI